MQKVIENLKKNNIDVIRCSKIQEIPGIVKNMLFEGAKISTGGSLSLKESGVLDIINEPSYKFFNRNREGISADEQQEIFKEIIGIDFYFCSANAVTENGELLNVDGFSNRIAAIAFGPKKVVMVVGKNKIVKDLNEAFLRVKTTAAPKNCVRLGIDNPCAKLGHCISLLNSENPNFTDGCSNPRRICVNYLISGPQRIKDRITVILCDEDLGY